MSGIWIALVISLIFSPIAALSAFLITYNEYLHHFPDKKKTREIAVFTAISTFTIFVLIFLVIGLFIPMLTS